MRVNPALDRGGAHPIAAIQQQVRDLRAGGSEVIDFSIGDPTEPTWPLIRRSVTESVPAISQYPTTRGLPALRSAIAGYVQRRFGLTVDPDTQIMPTSGSKEAIFSSHLAFVDRLRDDLVGYPDPGYPVYERGAVLAGAEAVPIPADADFVVTAGSVPVQAWQRLVMLWICTPSNPTGAITGRSQMEELVAAAREADVLLCSDECYIDLYENEPPVSVLEVAGEGADGVLSYLSLSKRSGMTGYRSGAIVGDPGAIEQIHRLRTSTGTASPEFVQEGAVAAWGDDRHVADRRRVYAEKRRVLRSGLEQAGVEVAGSQAGLYVWVRVGDDVAVTGQLAARGVIVSPGRIFGRRGEGYLRLALVPDVDTCRRAVELIASVLAG
jgi:succinyldiaminopimelate transaminase